MKTALLAAAAAVLVVAATACSSGSASTGAAPKQEVLGSQPVSPTEQPMQKADGPMDSSMSKSGATTQDNAMPTAGATQGGGAMPEPTKAADSMMSNGAEKDGAMVTDSGMAQNGSMGSGGSTQPAGSMGKEPAMQSDSMMNPEERYVEYSPDAMAKALRRGRVVLFFTGMSASAQADKDFQANLAKIPQDVTVLKVGSDTAPDLKNRYHVMGDPTFVQVDASGNQVGQWMGTGLTDLLSNLK